MPKRKTAVATLHDQLQQMVTKDDHSQLSSKVDALAAKVDSLADALRNGFQSVNAQLNDLHNRVDTVHGLMENLLVRVERLEQEYIMITAGLKRLEERFDQLDAIRLRERIEALEKRVTALESVQN